MSKLRVLLADDDELVVDSMRTALELRGYDVIEAVDGKEALEKYRASSQWDMVILDLVMPHLDGQEVLTEIKRSNPTAKVLLMSAAGKSRDYGFLKAYANVQFLSKPFTTPKLFSILERWS